MSKENKVWLVSCWCMVLTSKGSEVLQYPKPARDRLGKEKENIDSSRKFKKLPKRNVKSWGSHECKASLPCGKIGNHK